MIKDQQKANATNFNAAFTSRTGDTDTTGVLSLKNTSNVNSGQTVTNTQRAINETFDTVGMTGEGDASRKNYSSQNYVTNGDSHKVAIGKLDAQANLNATGSVNVSRIDGVLPITKGGTGQSSAQSAFDALSPTTTEGDLIVRGLATNGRLSIGTSGQVLTADLTVPGKVKWAPAPGGDLSTATGTLQIANGGTGATTQQAAITNLTGTQTSGRYLRSNGTNAILSAIQAADVPTLNQNTTGTAANVTGVVAIANGGSGQTTANAALNAFLPSQTNNSGKVLTTDGTNASWVTSSANRAIIVASYGTLTATQFNAGVPIKYANKIVDTTNSYSSTTGGFSIPETGAYEFSISGSVSGAAVNYSLFRNGTSVAGSFGTFTSTDRKGASIIYQCTQGEVMTIVPAANVTFTDTNGYIGIKRI